MPPVRVKINRSPENDRTPVILAGAGNAGAATELRYCLTLVERFWHAIKGKTLQPISVSATHALVHKY